MAWHGKVLRDLSNNNKKFEQKSKESLEEKKYSISKKVLQRLTLKSKNFIQTPKLKQFAGPVKRRLFGRFLPRLCLPPSSSRCPTK